MADNDTPEAMTARFDQMRQSQHEWLESQLKDHPSELARRKAAYDAQHAELLAAALRYEANRQAYLKGRP